MKFPPRFCMEYEVGEISGLKIWFGSYTAKGLGKGVAPSPTYFITDGKVHVYTSIPVGADEARLALSLYRLYHEMPKRYDKPAPPWPLRRMLDILEFVVAHQNLKS